MSARLEAMLFGALNGLSFGVPAIAVHAHLHRAIRHFEVTSPKETIAEMASTAEEALGRLEQVKPASIAG